MGSNWAALSLRRIELNSLNSNSEECSVANVGAKLEEGELGPLELTHGSGYNT